MKIVIIEDEQLTANDLAATIQTIEPNAEITAFFRFSKGGVELFWERGQC